MIKIDEIRAIVVSLPERRPHLMAQIDGRQGEYVIVTVRSDGCSGFGECTVLRQWGGDHGRYYGEIPALTARLVEEHLGPVLVGEDASRFGFVMSKLDHFVKGYPYAKAGICMALYDLVGKIYGVPAYQLMGGMYRDRIPIAHSLGIMEDSALLAEVEIAVAEGAKTIKLKAGLDPVRDVRIIRAVRRLVGPKIAITVDANQGWPDAKTAVKIIRGISESDILFVEQPVEGLSMMREVTRRVDVPIMADESAWNEFDVLDIAREGAADMISIYTTKPAGLYGAMRVASVAGAAGFRCNVNGSAETGIGNAANIQLAAAAPCVSEACVLPVSSPAGQQPTSVVGRSYMDDIILAPFDYHDGCLAVPSGPGLGVELDQEKVRKYRVN